MTVSPPVPSDATCAVCSKPIRSGGFIITKDGETVHIRCRSEQLRLEAIEPQARAELARARASTVAAEARLRAGVQPTGGPWRGRCPVCGGPATLTDWRPQVDWTAIEDCPCLGFFVWTPLLDEGRLARLMREDRESLSQRIQDLRATQTEAWLTTRDGTVMGAMIIRSERPDRPR